MFFVFNYSILLFVFAIDVHEQERLKICIDISRIEVYGVTHIKLQRVIEFYVVECNVKFDYSLQFYLGHPV